MDEEFPTYTNNEESTVPIRVDSDTHIGMEKKSGGWLENEIDRILRFAGFKTQRERRVIFEETTDEHYRIDILAKYDDVTLFVECKDYSEIKVNEKILFTLIGQVHDYRLSHPNETVIGVLVTSAKNVGQNLGIQNKLLREGCHLWDGIMIQKLQEKMIGIDRKSEFTTYLLEKLDYLLTPDVPSTTKAAVGQHKFHCRLHCYSIPKVKYIGNKFSYSSIISDINSILHGTSVSISNYQYRNVKSSSGERIELYIDFEKILAEAKIKAYWKSKSGFFKKPKESPLELMEIKFESECIGVLTRTYGIEHNDPAGTYLIRSIARRSQ